MLLLRLPKSSAALNESSSWAVAPSLERMRSKT
jgi:hypothetical protein